MKKLYFTLLFILTAFGVFAQTYTLNGSSNWNGTVWSDASTVWTSDAATTYPPNHGSGTIVIPSGSTMTISDLFYFNGTIIVKDGGTVVFNRDQPNRGQLVMDTSSEIIMESGSTITSTGPGGDQQNYLEVGGFQLTGGDINALPAPPYSLDVVYAACVDGGGTTCTPTALPVILLYFTAKVQNQSVEITWASSKAWDFSHYELERSANGKNFDYVATIDAAEFSNETTEYTFSDNQPLFGTSYYRLKAVDVDGAFENNEMAAVKFGAESFKVYPNPSAGGFIHVDWSHATEGASLTLTDNTGRAVRNVSLDGTNNTISTEGLTGGMYVLTIKSAAGSKQAQLIIK